MAKRKDIDITWVEELFTENESIIVHKMQRIIEQKKCVIELKSKICSSENQKHKLKEYIKLLESIICKSSNQIKLSNQHFTNIIREVENSINNLKKAVAVLELQKKHETKSNESNKKLVLQMKKILSEFYNNNFDSLMQKENRLLELQNEIKEYNTSYIYKAKQELDNYIKEYDLLKSKNIHLNKILSINIKQNM